MELPQWCKQQKKQCLIDKVWKKLSAQGLEMGHQPSHDRIM